MQTMNVLQEVIIYSFISLNFGFMSTQHFPSNRFCLLNLDIHCSLVHLTQNCQFINGLSSVYHVENAQDFLISQYEYYILD